MRHLGCISAIRDPQTLKTAQVHNATPVALVVLLPLIKNHWEAFDAAMATQRTAMLRHLCLHEPTTNDFDPHGPKLKFQGSEVSVISLAAYMCHALPMHSMLLVRLPQAPERLRAHVLS